MKSYLVIPLFFMLGCASIKKDKKIISQNSIDTSISSKTISSKDSIANLFKLDKIINLEDLTVIVEERVVTKKTIDSAGVQIVIPETTIKKTTYTNIKSQTTEKVDTSKVTTNTQDIITNDSTSSLSENNILDLQKESESINFIEEIISGIIGGGWWKNIIFGIIALILLVVLIKKIKQIKNEKIN